MLCSYRFKPNEQPIVQKLNLRIGYVTRFDTNVGIKNASENAEKIITLCVG